MEHLIISETDNTPAVSFNFDEGLFEIKGVSFPEYAREFYQPIIDALNQYVQNPLSNSTRMSFKFRYFNTGTNPLINGIMKELEELEAMEGHHLEVKWYYEEYDEDMRELGEYFKSLSTLTIQFVPLDEII